MPESNLLDAMFRAEYRAMNRKRVCGDALDWIARAPRAALEGACRRYDLPWAGLSDATLRRLLREASPDPAILVLVWDGPRVAVVGS
jgi:hypothetical protein